MTRWRHLEAVEALEAQATDVVLGALGGILSDIASRFGAVVAAAAEDGAAIPAGEAVASLDDLTRIQPEWVVRTDGIILPYYETVFEAGSDGAVEQIAGMRDVEVEVITRGDPLVVDQRRTQHLAAARDRFLGLGDEAWESARSELLQGFSAGEGIEPLRRRIEDVVDISRAKATALARTEVISASNAGATAQVDAMGDNAPPFKQWISTNDARTRPTHRRANNQVVAKGEQFEVGDASLDYPGDPSGPAAEVINCRCSLLFTDTADVERLPDALLAEIEAELNATAAGQFTGDAWMARQAMAALKVGRHSRSGLDRDNAELRLASYARARRPGVVHWAAALVGPVQVDSTSGEVHTGGMVALIPSAADVERLTIEGGEPAEQLHLTLRYLGDSNEIPPEMAAELRSSLADWAASAHDGPIVTDPGAFGVSVWNPTGEPSLNYSIGGAGLSLAHGDVDALVDQASASAGVEMPEPHDPWVAHVCAAYSPADPGIVDDMIGRLGPVTFDRVRLALGGALVIDYELGKPTDPAPTEEDPPMPETAEAAPADTLPAAVHEVAAESLAPLPGEHWHAVMHTQGESTGLRTFLNLSWRTPPFAFHWQYGSAAHGGTPATTMVGLVTRVVPDPGDANILHAFGNLDLGANPAREYGRQLVGGFARSVSIGLDEQPVKRTVVYPPDIDQSDPMAMMEAIPDQVIIDGGRIGELTGVSVPAQDSATIEPTPELVEAMAEVAPSIASPLPGIPVLSVASPVDDHGVLTASAATIERPSTADVADAVRALAASSYRIEVREAPPAAWFQAPTDVDLGSALMVTDKGRIYGMVAPLGVNHRAYAKSGQRREVPFGNVDYSKFLGAWGITAAGLVPAGPLTMDTGHAPMYRQNAEVGPAHYDNSASVVGSIAVGEDRDRRVVWAAGALLPGVTPEQVARILACRMSGDWQPHADRAGWMELIACLLVPSPGYAAAHSGPSLSYDENEALVASSVPVRMAEARTGRYRNAAEHIAASIGVGRRDRLAEALHIVGGED